MSRVPAVAARGLLPCWLALGLVSASVFAQPWVFDEPVQIADATAGVFHQMSSAGRRSLAVSGGIVAVVWEDEHEGTPRVYLARKDPEAAAFSPAVQVSGERDAFEPSVLALPGGRFAVAWEEDGRTLIRLVAPERLGSPLQLSPKGGQVSLAPIDTALDGDLVAVWADREAGFGRIIIAVLVQEGDMGLAVRGRCSADSVTPTADQLFPTASQVGDRLLVAWEDRRPGHTIIMGVPSRPGQSCAFDPPARISEDPPGPDMPFGAGHGVARVALAPYGSHALLAVWEDKRNFRHGYDVYASHFGQGGDSPPRFGPNERVQDDFGELAHQWHVTAAGHPDGTLVVAWTDEREGQGDILLSWYADGTWSEDLPLPGGSGPDEQAHPTLSLDEAGNLHAAWVSREAKGGPTRIQYVLGRRGD
jgi:hypothetical protein